MGLDAASSIAWLPAAIATGALLHTLGDLLTPEGVPLLWPLPRRFAVALLGRTGGSAEALVGLGLLACSGWLAAPLIAAW